jgi:hypothetical protein
MNRHIFRRALYRQDLDIVLYLKWKNAKEKRPYEQVLTIPGTE